MPEIYHVAGMHDSGYRGMGFVACKDGQPFKYIGGLCDVVHIEGIGGYGRDWLEKYGTVPPVVEPTAWSIDCLKTSGLLRLFPMSHEIVTGTALSSFEVYAVKKRRSND